MNYQSDRHFQLWDYTVSHAQMLLRSPAHDDEPFNIDIVLLGVVNLEIPTRLRGLEISGPEPLGRRPGDPTGLFRLTSQGKEFTVVAAGCKVFKNQLDIMESSLEYFGPESPIDPGEVLCHSGTSRLPETVAPTNK